MKRISTNRVAQSTKYVVKLCGLFVARVIVSISDCILVTLNQDKKGVYWKTLFSDESDDSVKDSINTFGAFNARTGKFDDGTDLLGGFCCRCFFFSFLSLWLLFFFLF